MEIDQQLIFNRKGWQINILPVENSQEDEESSEELLYQVKCQNSETAISSKGWYKTVNTAKEIGELLVDREWEKQKGIKRKINLDLDEYISALCSPYSKDTRLTGYIDLITGDYFLDYYDNNVKEMGIDPDEFYENDEHDRYLALPDLYDLNDSDDIDDFIESFEDKDLQIQVSNAFYRGGKGRYKRVRNIVGYDFNNFQDKRREERLREWLESENLVIASEATEDDYIEDDESDQEIDDFNPDNLTDERSRVQASIVRRQGQSQFRSQLLQAYQGKCAISGTNVEQVLDAAHIIAYQGVKSNSISNGLLLRKDLHTLFDLKLITIDPDKLTVLISPDLKGTIYEQFAHKKINLPADINQIPNKIALQKHNEECNWLDF
jgi:hypothetical protein